MNEYEYQRIAQQRENRIRRRENSTTTAIERPTLRRRAARGLRRVADAVDPSAL